MTISSNFWKKKKLKDYTEEEWEAICTNCGRCCLIKLQDEESDDIFFTDIICRYHDTQTHKCTQYCNRCELVPTCLKLTPENINNISWIPETCAYYILAQTGSLPAWHPLVSKQPLPEEFKAPNSCISELMVPEEELEDHIIEENDDE